MCTFGVGISFGESILTNQPRQATVVTKEFTELVRIEQKDFRILWEVIEIHKLEFSTTYICK